MKIPVSIIEDHSDCLFQLQRLLGRNKLPLTGFSMLHFDSHPDMCASPDFREENLENAKKMREKVSIESWILPLVVAGHLKVFPRITFYFKHFFRKLSGFGHLGAINYQMELNLFIAASPTILSLGNLRVYPSLGPPNIILLMELFQRPKILFHIHPHLIL